MAEEEDGVVVEGAEDEMAGGAGGHKIEVPPPAMAHRKREAAP